MMPIKCGDCGADLSAADTSEQGETPCPHCGSVVKQASMNFSEQISISDHLTAAVKRQGRLVGYTESERNGRTSWAQQNHDQSGALVIRGNAPQGEEDTISCCRLLIKYLNSHGGQWNDPQIAEGDVDCRTVDICDGSRMLEIQIVRATVENNLWRALNRDGEIRREMWDVQEIANAIRDTIQHKVNRIEPERREQLLLALDATRLPLFVFDEVPERFRQVHGEWARGHRFREIWIVGPPNSRCWQLDARTAC